MMFIALYDLILKLISILKRILKLSFSTSATLARCRETLLKALEHDCVISCRHEWVDQVRTGALCSTPKCNKEHVVSFCQSCDYSMPLFLARGSSIKSVGSSRWAIHLLTVCSGIQVHIQTKHFSSTINQSSSSFAYMQWHGILLISFTTYPNVAFTIQDDFHHPKVFVDTLEIGAKFKISKHSHWFPLLSHQAPVSMYRMISEPSEQKKVRSLISFGYLKICDQL